MQPSNIIYLDTSFIVEIYDQTKCEKTPVKITRSTTFSGTGSLGFVSGGAATVETKEFPVSVRGMYEEIKDVLMSLPGIDLKSTGAEKLPDYFWTTGVLGATSIRTTSGDRVSNEESFFSLDSDLSNARTSVFLVTNNAYLSTGYDQVQKHLSGCCSGFAIQVRGLFKLLSVDPKVAAICSPLVMEKTGYV